MFHYFGKQGLGVEAECQKIIFAKYVQHGMRGLRILSSRLIAAVRLLGSQFDVLANPHIVAPNIL